MHVYVPVSLSECACVCVCVTHSESDLSASSALQWRGARTWPKLTEIFIGVVRAVLVVITEQRVGHVLHGVTAKERRSLLVERRRSARERELVVTNDEGVT